MAEVPDPPQPMLKVPDAADTVPVLLNMPVPELLVM